MNNEIWKAIRGYEGFYEISNMGRVRSIDRTIVFRNDKGKREYKGKILRQKHHNEYAMVNLNKNKNMQTLYVHRLVAETFLENPHHYNVVNHRSGVKSDNCVTNLEWCTSEYNNNHARLMGLHRNNTDGLQKYNDEHKIQVSCFFNGKLIKTADSSREMAKYLLENKYIVDVSFETVARAVRKYSNSDKTYHGYVFKRHNELTKEELNGKINILYNDILIMTCKNSSSCAEWLLKNGSIVNANQRTVARSIRKAIKENKPYHNFLFKKAS